MLCSVRHDTMSGFFRSSDGCSIHREEKYISVCNQCDKSVCMLCMVSLHQGHTFTDNEQALTRYRDKLTLSLAVAEESLTTVQQEIQQITQHEQICYLKSDGLLITIQNRGRSYNKSCNTSRSVTSNLTVC